MTMTTPTLREFVLRWLILIVLNTRTNMKFQSLTVRKILRGPKIFKFIGKIYFAHARYHVTCKK